MQRLNVDDTLIAPGEVRELLSRLTTQSIESLGPEEPRTLGGIALKTGVPVDRLRSALDDIRGRKRWTGRAPDFVVIGLVGAVLTGVLISRFLPPTPPTVDKQFFPSAPAAQPQAPAQKKIDMSGLVPLSQVTYGPDAGSQMVEPSFHPSKPLPDGVSISAEVDSVLWGAGDAHSAAATEFHQADISKLRTDLCELLEHVRDRAAKRGASSTAERGSGIPVIPVTINIFTYNGVASIGAEIPVPGEKYDGAAREAIDEASGKLAAQFEETRRFQEENRRDQGP